MAARLPGYSRSLWVSLSSLLTLTLIVLIALSWYWSREPEVFWVQDTHAGRKVPGYATTSTLIEVAEFLLDKPGGYLSNDVAPPGWWLDNMPNFEFGVLVQVRELAKALRNDYSRSQSQSTENEDLAQGEPQFSIPNDAWIFPSSESEYRDGIEALQRYQEDLLDASNPNAQFFARADNLREWLAVVEKRLGSLSQRLSASVGQARVNTDLDGDSTRNSATPQPDEILADTPWWQIDDVFFEARGTAWALVHFLRAAELDFADVLADKNAIQSTRQIIRELEASLEPMRSPVILNGSGYGFFANHSLVMASYISRANSAVINLRELLDQG